MIGNQRARKRVTLVTNKDRFLGALWNALNCSTSNGEILEVMDALSADNQARIMSEIYSRSKTKGTREQAIEDIKAYISFH